MRKKQFIKYITLKNIYIFYKNNLLVLHLQQRWYITILYFNINIKLINLKLASIKFLVSYLLKKQRINISIIIMNIEFKRLKLTNISKIFYEKIYIFIRLLIYLFSLWKIIFL